MQNRPYGVGLQNNVSVMVGMMHTLNTYFVASVFNFRTAVQYNNPLILFAFE